MKIGIVVDDYAGGAGNIAQILAIKLRDSGNNVSLFLTYPYSKPRYDIRGITVYENNLCDIKGNYIKKFVGLIRTTKHYLIDKMSSELVISFLDNNNSLTCLALWNLNIPIIVAERSNPMVIYPKFPWNYIRKLAYRRADVVSVQFKEFCGFENGCYENKCYVTPNIVKEPHVKKEDYKTDVVRFITVCRLHEIKRLDLMIDMFYAALKENRNIELYIFGEGTERVQLEQRIAKYCLEDKIFLMGSTSKVYEELVKCDVFLMTSLQEGFPNSLCEALAVGLPAVCFECHYGITELLNDGEYGFSICEGDKKSYINAMLLLAADKERRSEMGNNAKQISRIYSMDEVFQKWEMCIKIALKKRQGI